MVFKNSQIYGAKDCGCSLHVLMTEHCIEEILELGQSVSGVSTELVLSEHLILPRSPVASVVATECCSSASGLGCQVFPLHCDKSLVTHSLIHWWMSALPFL